MKTNNSVKLKDTIWKPDKANGEKATVFFCFKRTEHTFKLNLIQRQEIITRVKRKTAMTSEQLYLIRHTMDKKQSQSAYLTGLISTKEL